MSAPAPPTRRAAFRSKLQKLSFSREHQMIGPAEIIALACGVLMMVLAGFTYIYFLIPANSRLEALQSERSRLLFELQNSKKVLTQDETTEATVQKITASLDDFESNQLLASDRGRMALYDVLNELIRKSGVRNTSGPTYAALESSGLKNSTAGGKTVNTKWQSIYPGIAISVTVEGQYQTLRRFIRDIETTKQFIIINSVELERSSETNNTVSSEGGPTDGGRSSLVSLRLEMATYFQRAGHEDSTDSPATH
ncbi:MAG TPA: GspMb/PilO family protein [Pyrinomonadaceae bacterium]|nr:GspMb/PilO family protein [Pyrinomonadaceae bacterium]